jgi:hypothetical protein
MPSLSEKLKALGVNIGTDGLLPASKTTKYPIEKIIDGQEVNTPFGQTFVVDKTYSSDPRSENLILRYRNLRISGRHGNLCFHDRYWEIH